MKVGAVPKGRCTYLWRELEHGGAHDERGGVVLRCQRQGVSAAHGDQRPVGQDRLRTNDDLKRQISVRCMLCS